MPVCLRSFAVLAALSDKAAEWATARVGPEEMAEPLRWLATALETADDAVAANWRFHRIVNHASGSPRLLAHLRQAVRAHVLEAADALGDGLRARYADDPQHGSL